MNVHNFTPEQMIQYNTLVEQCKKGFPNVPDGLAEMVCETYVDTPTAFNKVCDMYRENPNCFKEKYGLNEKEKDKIKILGEDENVLENKESK